MSPSCHVPVLLAEVIDWLRPTSGNILVDGTFGGGGHATELAERVQPAGRVIAMDRDAAAIERWTEQNRVLPIELTQGNFVQLPQLLSSLSIDAVDGILLDLGLSSDQLADDDRGFSFQSTGPLDLRFNPEEGEPAWELLARLDEKSLADLIYRYGEERYSRRIARRIAEQRREQPVRTATELASLVRSCMPRGRGRGKSGRRDSGKKIDAATRTFQALRIAVNGELQALETALAEFPDLLQPGGRLAVISFHSLEDRLVKWAFRNDDRLEVLTRRPIQAGMEEVAANPRARSAKLRVAERRSASDQDG